MSTVADKLTALHGIKADLFAATREKGLDTAGRTLENLHELWGGISSGGALQAKTAVPSSADVEVTPDAGYNALSAVNIAAALNLKPWNIRKGKTLFGITGTAEIAVSTDVPPDIPAQKDDADDAYEENVGEAPTDRDGNALDMMVLADDDGNITYGYFLQGAANGSANGRVTITIGDTIPEDAVLTSGTGNIYFLVSKLTPSSEELESLVVEVAGKTLSVSDGTAGFESGDYITPVWVNLGAISTIMYVVTKDNYTYADAITFPLKGIYFGANYVVQGATWTISYTTSTSGFTITTYETITTNFSAVGWRRLSYHTTGELAGQWTYDDFSTTASSGGNFLKNIIQCSREKLYYNGAEVWPNPDQSAITAEEVTT